MDFDCLKHSKAEVWGFFWARAHQTPFWICQTAASKLIFGEEWETQSKVLIPTGQAVVDVGVAVAAGEAGPALAQVTALDVVAQGVVLAGLGETLINIHCASFPWKVQSARVRPLPSNGRRLRASTAQHSSFPTQLPSQPGAHWQV